MKEHKKSCSKCKSLKSADDFSKNKNSKDGLFSQCKSCRKAYRDANKQWYIDYQRKYRAENRDKVIKSAVQYKKRRRELDPTFRMIDNFRSRVTIFCRKVKMNKKQSSLSFIGCSVDDFKVYIESKFMVGMSWDNYGEWHIDHIIPISSALSEEDIKSLNHYSNLQPLWAFDNMSKGNRVL
jgi:hypothetical protein